MIKVFFLLIVTFLIRMTLLFLDLVLEYCLFCGSLLFKLTLLRGLDFELLFSLLILLKEGLVCLMLSLLLGLVEA